MTPREVIASSARSFGLRPATVLSERKSRTISMPRKAAIWVLRSRREPPPSYPAIGRHVGRNHSSVLHAFRDAEKLRDEDPGFRLQTDRLLADARPIAHRPEPN